MGSSENGKKNIMVEQRFHGGEKWRGSCKLIQRYHTTKV